MGDADRDDPLSDLADRVGRQGADADADESSEASPFESMAVESVDPETLWAELADADTDAAAAGAAGRAEAVEGASGEADHVVPKRSFCQSCLHFATPPAFACTRAGTEIVEVVDADRFRVRNCPVARDAEADSGADSGTNSKDRR
ncbi:hypothetical protein NDI76_12175 [Halogeometricum sp. S1BR25-6]|uniref:DUF8135 domain-containing protein n=1 Tax=Halogeometricum salsisoli TaxID=2950536 RepID=A0ABU2GH62_9EURY|nr:hypothetical protein [Halogeometricum sp. S1BR25-6]MDS0299499.1 hypothetical protein [Halogeometricum sp. S1BR25-6]